MEDIAGWIAPIATALAAMMTASNLGPRMTGWGFVVFVAASISWVTVAVASGQTNLLLANGFLTLVNIVGVWRWLGREARWGDRAEAAEAASQMAPMPTLFAIGGISGSAINGAGGQPVAHAVDAMAECATGRIRYLLIREGGAGGVGERIHMLDWSTVNRTDQAFDTSLDAAAVRALPEARATA